MVHCAVMGCSNNNNKKCNVVPDCRFFSFPKDKKVCDQWILRCYQKHKFNIKTARICSDHFLENDYCLKEKILELPQNKWKLKSDAVPSVNLMKSPREPTSFQQERSMRMEKRLNKEIIQHKMSHVNAVTEIQNENVEDKENVSGKTRTASTQTASNRNIDIWN
ncbi:unnamed protein product [Callosobruchus maculatus]|uniref:THAP-type domain-containing protein n=1 Tax=Callosobruchus maculatus TaxID=64391 RepID=A0A653CFR3_CALMS|nr:unnamed protein product [Callosobruchus maculatus]